MFCFKSVVDDWRFWISLRIAAFPSDISFTAERTMSVLSFMLPSDALIFSESLCCSSIAEEISLTR